MGGTCQTQLGGRHHRDPAQTSSPSLPVLSALTSPPHQHPGPPGEVPGTLRAVSGSGGHAAVAASWAPEDKTHDPALGRVAAPSDPLDSSAAADPRAALQARAGRLQGDTQACGGLLA